ncbi:MAG: hypothetical protein NVSMB17_01360 [Candidatus Dormibacteria bacterium]
MATAGNFADLTRLPGIRVLRNRRVAGLALAIVAGGALVYFALLLVASFSNMPDFRSIFVPEARDAWAGRAIYHFIAPAPPGRFTAGFAGGVDSPVFLLFLWPWTIMADLPGRLSWQVVEVLSLGTAVAIAYRGLGRPGRREAVLAVAMVLFLVPVRDSIQEGQLSITLGALVAAALLGHQQRRPLLGGLCLGLAIGLKLTPLLLLPYFAYRRDARLCLAALATATALGALILVAGWAPLLPPYLQVIGQLSHGTAIAQNQAVSGFVLRATNPALTGFPIAAAPLAARALIVAGQLSVLAYLAWATRRLRLPAPEHLWVEFSIVLLLVPLLQPFAWPHHFAWAVVVVPVGIRLAARGMVSQRRAAGLVLVFLALTLLEFPLYSAAAAHPADLATHPMAALGASLTLYGVLATAALLSVPRGPARAAAVAPP